MIRLFAVLLALVALAPPAAAQMPQVNMMPDVPSKTPEEKEQERLRDKAYRETLRKIPDAKASDDPWGDVRGSQAAKFTAKSATTSAATKSATVKPRKPAPAN